MKLYTRAGDDGQTIMCAPGGKTRRMAKDTPLLAALGEVDELNSAIGLCLSEATRINHIYIHDALAARQRELFTLGAMVGAMAVEARPAVRLDEQTIADIERQIDYVCQDLPELKHFILPGGSELAGRLHLARSICRRAERVLLSALAIMRREGLDLTGEKWDSSPPATPADALVREFINRLSDLLFALARLANRDAGEADIIWTSRPQDR